MAGHRQAISRISKCSRNNYIDYCIVNTCDSQGGGISVRAFALACPGVAPGILHADNTLKM